MPRDVPGPRAHRPRGARPSPPRLIHPHTHAARSVTPSRPPGPGRRGAGLRATSPTAEARAEGAPAGSPWASPCSGRTMTPGPGQWETGPAGSRRRGGRRGERRPSPSAERHARRRWGRDRRAGRHLRAGRGPRPLARQAAEAGTGQGRGAWLALGGRGGGAGQPGHHPGAPLPPSRHVASGIRSSASAGLRAPPGLHVPPGVHVLRCLVASPGPTLHSPEPRARAPRLPAPRAGRVRPRAQPRQPWEPLGRPPGCWGTAAPARLPFPVTFFSRSRQ